ncbi:trypsin-like peptidase domain-containing protein [Verrucomicrobiaceae bacterium N1E253]|uniref:Trypsin-like peptidase domain-containing protein n=1 Tax=Oceaniferula marina TaxID=2748318 RepID=A0A851GIM3_9BACT|nr:trypsin-like peptidase domain-containing protein [Oceaniferula marina]NWK54074.1 trypsin-like peptidase domain-containing protein [Oceaniferula marina]
MNPATPPRKSTRRSFRPLFHILCLLSLGLICSCQEEQEGFDAKKAEQGVVRVIIAMKSSSSMGYGSGSGFYIGENTLITNHHVIDGADKGKLVVARKVSSNQIEIVDASVSWSDKELDIAILKVDGIGCDTLTLSEAPIEKGSQAYAIGFPTAADASRRSGSDKIGPSEVEFIKLAYSSRRGVLDNVDKDLVQFLDPTVSSGEVRKTLIRKWTPQYSTELEVIDHDVNIGHGNSGGPLFDECGRVIGINTQGLTFSVADNVKNSSRITELISVLKKQSISAVTTDEPCETSQGGGVDWKIWLVLGLVTLAALTSLLVALRKKPSTESYTQYIKRVSGVSRLQSRPGSLPPTNSGPTWDGGQIVNSPPTPPASPPPAPPAPANPPTPQAPSAAEANPFPQMPANAAGAPPLATDTPNGWSLQGNNPEAGKSKPIHFQLTPELIQRYGGNITIGRKPGIAHLVIDNTSISKAHAIISLINGQLNIRDNGSSNSTSVNGKRLTPNQPMPLNPGDHITLGEVSLSFALI